MSAALSQPKTWHAQSSICKAPCQNSEFHALWGYILPLHHLMNLSWSLSCPPQRTVSQICGPRGASSVGCKYRRGRVFGGQLRPEKVDERCGHWIQDILGRTCRLDETWVGVKLVGTVKTTWWSNLNQCLVGQLLSYCKIWLNLALGEYFTPRFLEGTAYRCSVLPSFCYPLL